MPSKVKSLLSETFFLKMLRWKNILVQLLNILYVCICNRDQIQIIYIIILWEPECNVIFFDVKLSLCIFYYYILFHLFSLLTTIVIIFISRHSTLYCCFVVFIWTFLIAKNAVKNILAHIVLMSGNNAITVYRNI